MSADLARRDTAIDLVRGFCIVSMVLAHLAPGHALTNLSHRIPHFDGLSGFVLLSGLVVGMVQRRRWERDGLAAVQHQTMRRIVTIASGHLLLMALTVVVAIVVDRPRDAYPLSLDDRSPGQWAVAVITGGVVPLEASVLRLYVVLLALAMVAWWLLSRRLAWVVVLGSAAVATYGWVVAAPMASAPLLAHAYEPVEVSLSAWQAVFLLPLVLGWYWRDLRVREWTERHPAVLLVVSTGLLLALHLVARSAPGAFAKYDAGPGRVAAAFAATAMLYGAAIIGVRLVPAVVYRPLRMVGRRSLDSYLIHAVALILVLSWLPLDTTAPYGAVVAVVVLLVCWAWSELRERLGRPRDVARWAAGYPVKRLEALRTVSTSP